MNRPLDWLAIAHLSGAAVGLYFGTSLLAALFVYTTTCAPTDQTRQHRVEGGWIIQRLTICAGGRQEWR